MAFFQDDFEARIAHLRRPVTHRKAIRTSNLLEHLFGEEWKHLSDVDSGFGNFPIHVATAPEPSNRPGARTPPNR